MCGIACLVDVGNRLNPNLLSQIESDLFHRGPDSGGRLEGETWALVFRRLAIMDPNETADQPMTDPAGKVSIVFNGEIYNFIALRYELEQAGVQFRTSGDSEVVLLGYLHWGVTIFEKLEGMFAVGLVDRRINKMIIARDPLGIKPLYFTQKDSMCAVASEAGPLTRLVGSEVDESALPELLAFGWAAGGLSNYRHIERIPGGTLISIDLVTGFHTRHRYCDPLNTLDADGRSTVDEAHQSVRFSLKAHLMSDVGYSLQLSGGIDSSLLIALAAEGSEKPISSYSVQVINSVFDESSYQKEVIDRYQLDNRSIALDNTSFTDDLANAVRTMEGPVPHGGCVALYILCREIGRHHKVVLTGEGADEMFGGYQRYLQWRKMVVQEMLCNRWPSMMPIPNIWPFKGLRRLQGKDFAAYASAYENIEAMSKTFPDLLPAAPAARERASARFDDFRDRLFAVDQTAYLESLLVRQDKMSMAHSVEARVPFVHMPLLSVVNKLPRNVRLDAGQTKPVLKQLAEQYLPHEFVHRRKNGLRLPYAEWSKDSNGLGCYLDLMSEPSCRLRAYSDRKRFDRVIDDFRKGNHTNNPRVFSLINMEVWLRSVSDRSALNREMEAPLRVC